MEKTTILGLVLAVIVFGAVVWFARPGTPSAVVPRAENSTAALSADELNFDFGTISMAAGKVTHDYKIKNGGTDQAVISKMYTSCMCTTALLQIDDKKFGPFGMPGHGSVPSIGEKLPPGKEAVVSAVFDPAAHGPAGVGRIQRSIRLETDSGKFLDLQFSAMVTP